MAPSSKRARVQVRGVVCSGKLAGASFVQLDWVRAFVRETFGFAPYPGTLNLRVEDRALQSALEGLKATAVEHEGFCRSCWWQAAVCGGDDRPHAAAIVRPEVAGYPEDLIELVAPVPLRVALGVTDGSILNTTIYGRGE